MITLHTVTLVAALVTCHTRQLSQGSGYVTTCEPAAPIELTVEESAVSAVVTDDATGEVVLSFDAWEACEAGDPLCTDLDGIVSFVGGVK